MIFQPKIQHAINIATSCHRDHKRIGLNLPYIVHPYSVALISAEYIEHEDVFCAALLHDVIEDSGEYSVEKMRQEFGDSVTLYVTSLTEEKTSSDSIETLRENWEWRKQRYIDNLSKAPHEALIICAADSIHNLQSLMELKKSHGEKFWSSFGSSMDKKMLFYGKVLAQLRQSLSSPIVEKLGKVYDDAKEFLL